MTKLLDLIENLSDEERIYLFYDFCKKGKKDNIILIKNIKI
jgi:hypothetical protein